MDKDLGEGYVQVYTGNGKGKTTAALGLAFRAWGRGLKTYIGQFMKGQFYGELASVHNTDGHITIEQFGKDTFIHVTNPPAPEDVEMAQHGLARIREAMQSGEYDLVVADELNTAHFFNLVSTEEILELMQAKPAGLELVITGRYCPDAVIKAADLVSEMTEVKHYYTRNVPARDGIER